MSQEPLESLLTYCRSELGEDLRVFTRYGRDIHEYIYTRPDILERFNEEERGRFRYPLMTLHRATWEMYHHHDFIDEPRVVTTSYGDTLFIQFPITETEGIFVSLDAENELPEGFLSGCKTILYGPE